MFLATIQLTTMDDEASNVMTSDMQRRRKGLARNVSDNNFSAVGMFFFVSLLIIFPYETSFLGTQQFTMKPVMR
jgi:hypothetical protein